MEQTVRVRRVLADGTAEVYHIRESACSGDCHKCSGCGAAKETVVFTAVDTIGVEAGDVVTVRSESAPVLRAAAVLYMLPLVLFTVGYILGATLGYGAPAGCLGFALGVALAVVYDRAVEKKRKPVYTITGYAKISKKGDNGID